jgi:hypothetical protein
MISVRPGASRPVRILAARDTPVSAGCAACMPARARRVTMLALVVGAPCGRRRVFRSAGDRPGAGWRGYARRRAPGPGDRARGQVQRDPGTRGVDRVAHGDRATVDVDVLVGDVQITHRRQRDRRERLVDLDRSTSAGVLPSRPNALRIALAGWHSSDGSGPATTPCLPISHPGSAVVFATADYHRPSTASGGGIGSGSPVNSSTSSPLIPVRQDAVELSFPL